MKTKNAVTKIFLDKSRPLKDGFFTVRLRVTFNRLQMFYAIFGPDGKLMRLTEDDFEKLYEKGNRGKNKELFLHLAAIETEAQKIIDALDPFSFNEFKVRFLGEKTDPGNDLLLALKARREELLNEGRISTATAYSCTINSLNNFWRSKTGKLPFETVNTEWLNKYEKWMLAHKRSPTTIGIYLRNVRTMFNDMIHQGNMNQQSYPFGRGKYEIPTGRNIKKALVIDQVRLLAAYQPITDSEAYFRDLWLFSYFCNGANMKDIARLTYSDVDVDSIRFVRAKTARSKKANPRLIQVSKIDQLSSIIEKWGNKPIKPSTYLFPILTPGISPQHEYDRIQQTVKMVNKYIERAAIVMGIEAKVTSYTARHTFATVLKRSGASIEYISESLGHADLPTTENYLADFEMDEKRKWAQKLI